MPTGPSPAARILNNPIVGRIASAAVMGAVNAASRPDNDMSAGAVAVAKPQIAVEVAKEIENDPVLQHITNSEAWYQKRSRWASIIGLVATVAAPLIAKFGFDLGPKEQELIVTACTTIGGLWAAYLAYRAGTASKPLGA